MLEHMGTRVGRLLLDIPFFQKVNNPELLASLFRLREFSDGQVIFNQGDMGESFWIILQGECRVYARQHGNSSEEVVTPLHTLGRHDFFGEISLLHDIPRTATVVSQSKTRLVELPKDRFTRFLSMAPEIKGSLKQHLLQASQREAEFRPTLSDSLTASAAQSWIDADIDHLAGIDDDNCPVSFDSEEVRQTPLAWSSGDRAWRMNGERDDALPDDILDPITHGRSIRHQWTVPHDCENIAFPIPTMFEVHVAFAFATDHSHIVTVSSSPSQYIGEAVSRIVSVGIPSLDREGFTLSRDPNDYCLKARGIFDFLME